MRKHQSRIRTLVLTTLLVQLVLVIVVSGTALNSTISGIVYGANGRPLPEVDIELLNENYAVRQRVRTDGAGRYSFQGVVDGRYFVRALPFRFDFDDAEVPVEVTTYSVRGAGVGFFSQDIFLKPKRGGLADTVNGVIFAEDVPRNVADLVKAANDDFQNARHNEGFEKLKKALAYHPKYFLALTMFGQELYNRKMYLESAQAFLQAVNVNPKSSKSFYYVGLSLSKLGSRFHPSAIAALKSAAVLAPNSFQVFYLMGRLERVSKNSADAEKSLLKAKKLTAVSVPEIHIELAQLYANDLKRYREAADELELYLKSSNASKEEQQKLRTRIEELRKKAE